MAVPPIVSRHRGGGAGRARPHALALPPLSKQFGLAVVFCAALAAGASGEKSAEIPKPYDPGPAERAHIARYDEAIRSVHATKISSADASALKEAFAAFAKRKPDEGLAAAKAISDPLAAKLAQWYRLRNGFGQPDEYRAFLDANPAWPDRRLLTERLEEALFTKGGTSTGIRSHFAKRGPDSGVGFAALASTYLAEGNTAEAKKHARKAWTELSLPSNLESGFLSRFGKLLTTEDHKRRLDLLIIEDIRWNSERSERAAIARRVIALLPEADRKAATARLAVFTRDKRAKALIDAVPEPKSPDWGLVYHRVQALRRADKIDAAAKLLKTVPTKSGVLVNPDAWWDERRAVAYEALKAKKYELAYETAADAVDLSANPTKEQQFMAGWLALRKLSDPARAEPHFKAFAKAADGPLSRAKAHYWLGRLAEVRKGDEAARAHYEEATRDPDTFHAQLAMLKLGGDRSITIEPPAEPTPEELARFNGLDSLRAAVIANRAGLPRGVARALITEARYELTSEAERAMIAHLADALGDTQLAVRTAKTAIGDRQRLLYYAYPVHPFPAYTALRDPPETAFLLAIARQETEFNTEIVSGAGAKGLLQVMSITAKHVCRDYKIKCQLQRLTSDPSYNAMLASAYIGDRMAEFQGSYVLTLPGYNAGPGRARQWIREIGDPRSPSVDPIDWIERIPIEETREYTAKVLSNIQVYRARLNGNEAPLGLGRDLMRARLAEQPPARQENREHHAENPDG